MCVHVGHPVLRLVRVRLGSLKDRNLPAGKWRSLTTDEIFSLEQKNNQTVKELG